MASNAWTRTVSQRKLAGTRRSKRHRVYRTHLSDMRPQIARVIASGSTAALFYYDETLRPQFYADHVRHLHIEVGRKMWRSAVNRANLELPTFGQGHTT